MDSNVGASWHRLGSAKGNDDQKRLDQKRKEVLTLESRPSCRKRTHYSQEA